MKESGSRGDEHRMRVALNASDAGKLKLRRYAIDESRFLEEDETASGKVTLTCPGRGQWAALLR